jgi:hypothetical protein
VRKINGRKILWAPNPRAQNQRAQNQWAENVRAQNPLGSKSTGAKSRGRKFNGRKVEHPGIRFGIVFFDLHNAHHYYTATKVLVNLHYSS